jgi:membrane protein
METEPGPFKSLIFLLRDSLVQWIGAGAFDRSASLAYYTIFSIVPLVTLFVSVGLTFSDSRIVDQFAPEITEIVEEHIVPVLAEEAGPVPTRFITEVISGITPAPLSGLAAVFSVLILMWGASSVFHQLQNSINAMYGLPASYRTIRHGILGFVVDRVLSVAFVVLIGLAFLSVLAVVAFIVWLPNLPIEGVGTGQPLLDSLLGLLLVPLLLVVLLALVYKYLPGGEVRWVDVLPGAILTAGLMVLGNRMIGLYLDRLFRLSFSAASGAVILFLIWIYYISMILLFGAKFIALFAERQGQPIHPKRRHMLSHAVG